MVDFLAAVPFGIAIGTGIVAFAYMLGSLLQSESLRAWSRLELAELVLSAILVLLVAEALSGAGQAGITRAFTGVSMDVAGVQQQMHLSMEQPLEAVVSATARNSMRVSKIISYNYNYQLPVPYVSPSGSSSPGAGAYPLQMAVMIGMDSTALNLMLVHAVKLAYVFLVFVLGAFFLPLGIILRFISPFRKIGSLLLGIGLAVYLVFPISVYWSTSLLAGAVLPAGYDDSRLVTDPGKPPSAGFTCSPVVAGLYTVGEQLPSWVAVFICSLIPFCAPVAGWPGTQSPPVDGSGIGGIVSYLMWLFQYGFPLYATSSLQSAGDSLNPTFISREVYGPMVGYLLPLAVLRNLAVLFMVLVELAATIVLARQFAQALGAEGQFYGLTKLV